MTDFHAHILPKADHGCKNVEMALGQLARAQEVGVRRIVATPHFYAQRHTVEEFLLRREYAYQTLEKENNTDVSIVKAAEVTLTSELANLPRLEDLCVGDTPYILLELPNNTGAAWVYDAIYKIESSRGLKPIIAHIDRYPKSVQDELLSMDLMIQINAEAFGSIFKRGQYLKLFQNGMAHLLGSDIHGLSSDHYKAFSKACKLLKQEIPDIKKNINRVLP